MKKIISIFILSILISANAKAFLGKGFNVEELSKRSGSVFMGKVLSVNACPKDVHGFPCINVTMKVIEKMKGELPSIYTFKQFAPKVGKQFTLIGMNKSSYVIGDKILVFLGGPSDIGFSAPIDFQLYRLLSKSDRQDDLDNSIVVNSEFGEKMNSNLFKNLQKKKTLEIAQEILAKKQKTGNQDMSFSDFKKLIRASVEP